MGNPSLSRATAASSRTNIAIAAATAAVGLAYVAFASFSSAPAAAGASQTKNQGGGSDREVPTKNMMDKKTSEARAGGSKDQGATRINVTTTH